MNRTQPFGKSALPLSAMLAVLTCFSSPALLQAQVPAPPALPTPVPTLEVSNGLPMPFAANADDTEALDAGPVHEAFAELVTLDQNNGMVAPTAPPEPINEIPPEVRPEGTNVEWFPGYWSWSEDINDFIWISGVWRDVPPGQQFVPGYWNETPEGWTWVSGFWTNDTQDELAYLPQPPATLETAPTYPQPADDYFWVPGCWQYRNSNYAWQAGFWTRGYSNWVWVPNRYRYTPRGYVYLGGYWDYPLARRGYLFSPVRYRRPIYRNVGYRYTPYRWVNTSLLLSRLFMAPNRGHYYYGNYASPRYAAAGYRPWIQIDQVRGGYDPFYTHASWNARQSRNSNWLNNYRNDFSRLAQASHSGPSHNAMSRHDAPRDFTRDIRNAQDLKQIGDRFVRLNDDQRISASRSRVSAFDSVRTQRAMNERSHRGGGFHPGSDGDGSPRNNGSSANNPPQRHGNADRGPSNDRASREHNAIERGTFKLPAEARDILNQHRNANASRSGDRSTNNGGNVPRSSLVPNAGSNRTTPGTRRSGDADNRNTPSHNRPEPRESAQPSRQIIPGAEAARKHNERTSPPTRSEPPVRNTTPRGNDNRSGSSPRSLNDLRNSIPRSIDRSNRPRTTEPSERGVRPNATSNDARSNIQRSIENSIRSRVQDSVNRSARPTPTARTRVERTTPAASPKFRSSDNVQRSSSPSSRESRPAFQPRSNGPSSNSGNQRSFSGPSRSSDRPARSSGGPSRQSGGKGHKGK